MAVWTKMIKEDRTMRNNTNTLKHLFAALLTIAALAAGHATAWAQVTISTAEEWNTFASNVNSGTTYSGQTVTLTADITITTGAGSSSTYSFKGIFEGGGHTLTLNLTHSSGGDAWIAPFRFINGATIKHLHTAGTISTNGKMAGGIVGDSWGTSTIQNCRSSVTISSSISGDGTHGGLVGRVNDGTLTINDCLFDGSITGANTNSCGGFVGWKEASLVLNRCLQAGDLSGISSSGGSTFSRFNSGSVDFSTCYYRTAYGTTQGTQTAATGSTLQGLLGAAWEVSGNDVLPIIDVKNLAIATISGISRYYMYSGSAINIEYDVTDASGSPLTKGTHYTETISPSATVLEKGDYTLTITGTDPYYGTREYHLSVLDGIQYVDAAGVEHTVEAIPLDGSEPKDEYDCVLLSAGTYYVGNTNPDGVDASYTCLVFNGPATLILGDGATMSVDQTVSNAEALFVSANAPLTIYGQTLGTGTLTVTNSGGLSGIRSSSDITINGGIIETTGSYGIHSYSNITLNGGTITATGIMAEGTSTRITLGGATVTSNSYSAGSITIVDGMGYVDGTGAVYYGTLWSEAKAAIANKTLTKDMSWTNLKAAFEAGGTQTVTLTNNVIRINSDHIEPTGTVTLDLNGYTIDGGTSQTNAIFKVYNGVSMTITDSRTDGNLCESGKNETVFVGEGGTLTLQSGTINAQSIGVYIYKGSFTMTGGTITGGTVSGVYLYGDNATFTMSGGTITGNAEGVKVNSATAMFIVSGNVDITGNTTKDVNMYYDYQSSTLNPIHIGGTLNEAARIGINIDDYTANAITGDVVKTVTSGLSGKGMRANFVLNGSDSLVLTIDGSGELAITSAQNVTSTAASAATVFSENKYVSTFYDSTHDYRLLEGAKAYTVNLDGDKLVFHLIGDDGSVIPLGTAVIIMAESGIITLNKLASTTVTAYADNILQGSNTEVDLTEGKVEGKTPYVLSISNGVLGFYKFTGSTIPAHKAYYLKSE